MESPIAVTGATGKLGKRVIDGLLVTVAAENIVALARDAAKAAPLAAKGVHVRLADYDDPGALESALAGVETLLLVSATAIGQRLRQHTNVVNAAKKDGVRHIVYTSAPYVDTSPLILAGEHLATEQVIRDSGSTFTFLRNNWYHENQLPLLDSAAQTGVVIGSTHGGTVAGASRADFAAAAVAVLTTPGHENRVYELAAETAYDYNALAAAIGEVVGKPVVYKDVSAEEHVAALNQFGLDEGTAGFVARIDADIAAGALSRVSPDLSLLIGRPATSLADVLRTGAA